MDGSWRRGEEKGKARHCWVPSPGSRAEQRGLNQGEGGGLFRWSETADGDVSSTPDWPRRLGQCRATRAAQPLTIAATPTRSAIARRGVAAAGAGANLPVTTAGLGLVAWVESQCWERKLRVGYEGGRGIWAFLQSQRQGKTIVRKQVQNKNKNRTRGEKRRIADADAVAKKTPKKEKKQGQADDSSPVCRSPAPSIAAHFHCQCQYQYQGCSDFLTSSLSSFSSSLLAGPRNRPSGTI